MNDLVLKKLTALMQRYQTVEADLVNQVSLDRAQYLELSREYAQLKEMVEPFQRWRKVSEELGQIDILLDEERHEEMRALALQEKQALEDEENRLSQTLNRALLPVDEMDSKPCFIEIRAGTGGEEAALFCLALFRMYHNYAVAQGWEVQIHDRTGSEGGGLKEIILKINGRGAYGRLRHESGGHRVQRVPETESQGRIHTSACVVLVIPEVPKQALPSIHPSDLRIDTFRASGAGGQHVNKTDSAVRITHLPTGIVSTCQNGRSQHQNRDYAMEILAARLKARELEQRREAENILRQSLLSSGSRTDRIRTYNFPQGRVTDHRIALTLYQLEATLEGRLDPLLDPLIGEYQHQRVTSFTPGQ